MDHRIDALEHRIETVAVVNIAVDNSARMPAMC